MLDPRTYRPQRAQDLLWFLVQELRRTRGDRGGLEAKWIRHEETYRAQPAQERKDFPFLGASNLVVPVMATDVDTLYSRLMGLLFEAPGLWTVAARRPEMEEIAPRMEEFLTWAQENEIEMNTPVGDWILDIMKLGTGVTKQRYNRQQKKVFEWRELDTGLWQQQQVILLKDAPSVHRVRLHNFWVPAGFKELDDMPWCAEDINLTYQQFQARVQAGVYYPTQDLSLWSQGRGYHNQPVQQAYDALSGYTASRRDQMRLTEFWVDFDIDEDGWDEALVCTIHEDTLSYVRLDLNPFFNQDKPYTVSRFMRDGNSFYGIGLGDMLDQFQEEVTAIHNQRIDAGTIGNSIMVSVTKNNTDIAEDEPIWPSKVWRVNQQGDVQKLDLGNPNGQLASITNEQASIEWAHRRDGVNDYVLGNSSPDIGYGTAYTTQQMLLNSTKRLGETVREVQRGLSEMGMRVLELYQQFNQHGKEFYALGQQDGSLVHMVLRFPLDLIRRGLRVGVRAIDAANSKDAQIRTDTVVLQQLMQFYQYYLQALSYMVNPQIPPPIQQAAYQMVEGASVMMRRLLGAYNIQDADKMIPDLAGTLNDYQRQLMALQQALFTTPPTGRSTLALGGPAQGTGGAAPNGGMGGVPAALGGPAPASLGAVASIFGSPANAQSPGGAGYGGAYPGAVPSPAFSNA